jgi:Icc-related predicted phosphoesterase
MGGPLFGSSNAGAKREETMPMKSDIMKVAAVADVHCNKTNRDVLHTMFARINETADVLLLCGDLSAKGLIEEAHILATVLTTTIKIPIIGVLGNHDFEIGKNKEIRQILCEAGVTILDGEIYEVHGIGFAGIKGFCGGFGRFQLEGWGEEVIKHFVNEAVDEALKLESALVRLGDMPIVVLMHYSPIQATVEGEPREIFPFLGSSRLEEPLNWFDISAVFHGHAHSGSPEGHTSKNIPVYNVSMPMLRRAYPDRPPYRLLEFPKPTT